MELQLETFKNFTDFELLDSGDGFRLERWGDIILARPDPQIIWNKTLPESEWDKAFATYNPGRGEDKGEWTFKQKVPKSWTIAFQDVQFLLKLSPFKHTGIFAEQAANWEWMLERIKKQESRSKGEKPKILNLFGYTGAASIVMAKAGCFVTHVDASKPTITWANQNQELNKLPKDSIRWILDDVLKFVQREVRRGNTYEGILMDPPAFGHSPTGKTWKFNQDLPELLSDCVKLLSPNAQFLLVNGYATNSSALALKNIMEDSTKNLNGSIEAGELCLKQKSERLLSTGIFARWNA